MTPSSRERFINALDRNVPYPGLVPHFELVFYLTMEAFGKVHPTHRGYGQWDQMEEKERELHRRDMADVYIATAERYGHDAIFIHANPDGVDETIRMVDIIREKTGDRFFLMRHGDATFSVPDGSHMSDFSYRIADDPDTLLKEAQAMADEAIRNAEKYHKHGGLDGFALCSDYCFNSGPFLSPRLFRKFITPFLTQITRAYRDMGFYVIKHTDGNIMPILDQLVESGPHALHSIDPMAGVDIAEVKRLVGNKVCLIGNVDCSTLDSGTPEQIIASTRYALQKGMPGGGFVFSTSNCIYTGMPLANYELMLDVFHREGIYS